MCSTATIRRSSAFICLALLVLAAAGCSKSPKAVFGELQDAALKKDPAAIWKDLSPETKAELASHAAELFGQSPAAAPSGAASGQSLDEGRQYLAMLAGNLEGISIEYIRSLRAGQVEIKGDTAVMNLGSLRFGPPEKPITFRKVDGKWLWDARETLDWYLENREHISRMSEGGL